MSASKMKPLRKKTSKIVNRVTSTESCNTIGCDNDDVNNPSVLVVDL